MLATPLDLLTYIVIKAREFDAEVAPQELEEGSNASDDYNVGILEDTTDNPTRTELTAALEDLNDDQKTELLALVWLGRGDFTRREWPAALQAARGALNERSVAYLIETPQLADLMEQGLAELGYSLLDEEKDRL